MTGHLSPIVGTLQADRAAYDVVIPVIPELWNDAIPETPVTDEEAVSEGDMSADGAVVVTNVCEAVVSEGDM